MEQVEKLPPQDIEMEMLVLGAALMDREAADEVFSFLRAEDFYKGAHRAIFEMAREVYEREQVVDQKLLRVEFQKAGDLEAIGGVEFIAKLVDGVPTTAHIGQYMRQVREQAVKRVLIAGATDAIRTGYEVGRTAEEVVSAHSRAVEEASGMLADSAREPDLKSVLKDIFETLDGKPHHYLMPTGLHELDAILGGIAPGDSVIIAALTSGGKTTLAMQLARTWARAKTPVAVFSYETNRERLCRMLAAAEARASLHKDGSCNDKYRPAVRAACGEMAEWPLFIVDRHLPLSQMIARVRHLRRKENIGAAFFDYLQQIPYDGKKAKTREEEIAAVSRGLKQLAGELNIPMVSCAQLNRADIGGGRPQLKRLRGSGTIEQDADIVIFLHDPDREARVGIPPFEMPVQAIVAKNRDGELGDCWLKWQRGFRCFDAAGSAEKDLWDGEFRPPAKRAKGA